MNLIPKSTKKIYSYINNPISDHIPLFYLLGSNKKRIYSLIKIIKEKADEIGYILTFFKLFKISLIYLSVIFLKIFIAPLIKFFDIKNKRKALSNKETILIVCHEASVTGAPILGLNLSLEFLKNFNVVFISLGRPSDLIKVLEDSGVIVYKYQFFRHFPEFYNLIIRAKCNKYNFKFALVNSIESRDILPILSRLFVPTITLIHEFASYSKPKWPVVQSSFWSNKFIFSSKITQQNFCDIFPYVSKDDSIILPQGKCVSNFNLGNIQYEYEKANLIKLLQLKDKSLFRIVGAGFVDYRKGVDLFIEYAACLSNIKNIHFYWIGNGYVPDHDGRYPSFLEDQLRRHGLMDKFSFIPSSSLFEFILDHTDLFVLTSRLDPLPNVAIDAMYKKIPVLCFDNTTGIADFLKESKLSKFCLARYLDIKHLAKISLPFINSKSLSKKIGSEIYKSAKSYFDMTNYIKNLKLHINEAISLNEAEKYNLNYILKSRVFNGRFAYPSIKDSKLALRTYLRSWSKNFSAVFYKKKPFPGFNPGIYAEKNNLLGSKIDPFVDFIKSNKPQGVWLTKIITENEKIKKLPDDNRVALHIHVFFPDLLPAILKRLSCNSISPDLFISITDNNYLEDIKLALALYKGKVISVKTYPNIGRDIAPFLIGFGKKAFENYDFVGHIHTKKSLNSNDVNMGKIWLNFLMSNLLGSHKNNMMDKILSYMLADNNIGLVYPDDPNIVSWGENLPLAKKISSRMKIDRLPKYFNFPIGTMFWARKDALSELFKLNLKWNEMPKEPIPWDGTLLHAIERIIPFAVTKSGFESAVTYVKNISR